MCRVKTIGTHTQVLNTNYVPTNPNYAETPCNQYFHTDALGSITSIADDTGTVVERRSYEAFGKIRTMDYGTNNNSITSNLTIETTRAFTGHEQIAELSGLIHMNARLYDSDIGRFLSADTIVQYPNHSQGYNRYSYIENNPLSAADPTGHGFWSKIKKAFKRVIRAVAIAVVLVIAVVAVAALVAYTAITLGATAAVTAGAVKGAVIGFTAGVVGTKANGGTWKDAFKNGFRGAAAGALGGAVGGHYGNNWSIGRVGAQATASGIGSELTGGEFKDGFIVGGITALSQWGYKGISSNYNESGEPHIGQEGKSDVGKILNDKDLLKVQNGTMAAPITSDQHWFMKGVGKYVPYGDAFAEFHDGLHSLPGMLNDQVSLIATMPPSYVLTLAAAAEPYNSAYTTAKNTEKRYR